MNATLNQTRTALPTRLIALVLLVVVLALLVGANLAARPVSDAAHLPRPVAVSVAVPADSVAQPAHATVVTALPLPQAEPVPPAE